MKQIRVIAPLGATIHGPAVLALTEDQAQRRTAVLKKARGKGKYELAAGARVMFKLGEELGIDGLDRLNRALFEDLDEAREKAEAEEKAKAEADAKAKPGDDAKAQAGVDATAESAAQAGAEATDQAAAQANADSGDQLPLGASGPKP